MIDIKAKQPLNELSQYPDVRSEWHAPTPRDDMPLIPPAFPKNGVSLNYFSMITTDCHHRALRRRGQAELAPKR
jgi:hypothetical protein